MRLTARDTDAVAVLRTAILRAQFADCPRGADRYAAHGQEAAAARRLRSQAALLSGVPLLTGYPAPDGPPHPAGAPGQIS